MKPPRTSHRHVIAVCLTFGVLSTACSGTPTGPSAVPAPSMPAISSPPTSVLAPVSGRLRVTNRNIGTSDGLWEFNQHRSGTHGPGTGIGDADDTYAWDINLYAPGNGNADAGQTVYAVADGEVSDFVGMPSGGGWGAVLIAHPNRHSPVWWSGYLHLTGIAVTVGQRVSVNTALGRVGREGATNDHLHLAVYVGANAPSQLRSFDVPIMERGGASALPAPGGPGTSRFVISASSLYLSEFSATGSDTLIGRTTLSSRAPVTVTDVATTPDGHTYAVSFSSLYSVDTATAILTPIGSNTLSSVNALVSDGRGMLWGASNRDGSLYRISRNDGALTLVGRFGSGWVSSGDLAFDSAGRLWAAVHRLGEGSDTLVTVNPSTGAATAHSISLPYGTYGMLFIDQQLFALSSSTNGLYVVDTSSGTVNLVRRLSFTPARLGF